MTQDIGSNLAHLFVCMGVSASGKSSLAKEIAHHFEFEYLEGDDFHPKENIKHMSCGKPLTDKMREPWMNAIYHALDHFALKSKNCVIANSALRYRFRNQFRSLNFQVHFLFLDVSQEVAIKRIQSRNNHFMPETLLDSQFDSLELTDKENDIFPVNADVSEDVVKAQAFQRIYSLI